MNPSTYLQLSQRTDGQTQNDLCLDAFQYEDTPDTVHGIVGISTEAGELLDALKKHMFYGKPLDKTNVKEELGDLLWYIAKLCRTFGWTLEEVMELNIAKLKSRFPDKFDPELAKVRDLTTERRVLEGGRVPEGRLA